MYKESILIEKIIPGGQALSKLSSGKKIFIWGCLPNEKVVDYEIIKNKSHFLEANATRVNCLSEHRVTPKDSCYLSTSPWQIIDYDYELKLKQDLVTEIFREHGIDISTPEIVTDYKDYFYRNKMEYSLYWNHELSKIQLSFHRRGSHCKIPINLSSIERPEIFNYAKSIIEELNARGEEARTYQSLLLRCNQKGEVSGGLYENGKPHPKFKNLTDTILGYQYSYSPNGFFQINLPVYELALKEIKKYITTEKVLDLYAGVGTIGLSVARDHRLDLVEIDKFAFNELCKNIFTSNIDNSITNEASRTLSSILKQGSSIQNGNIFACLSKSEEALEYINLDQTVILDPPRAGCDKKLIEKLLEIHPRTIIYLSCNPATQARDVKALLEKYRIKATKIFNFFPHTPHIENLLILC